MASATTAPERRAGRGARLFALPALVAALAAAGCGERTFDAGEIVTELNAAGAGLVLGQPLDSADEDIEVVAVSLEGAGGDGEKGEHGHAAGALVILENAEAATDEFTRCESAVDFTCFRAANAVLRFTGITPAEQARLTDAVRSMAND